MALTLSRVAGEAILVGDDVRLKVYRVRGGRVHLTFEAPRHVRIVREEIVSTELPAPSSGEEAATDAEGES